ncbi:hypothetical protein MVEG_10835 [Podila verticillata NRRL 6337]|nr:hypothetical protein MVEG_10835 [Podila verticillata NRRL 6337]
MGTYCDCDFWHYIIAVFSSESVTNYHDAHHHTTIVVEAKSVKDVGISLTSFMIDITLALDPSIQSLRCWRLILGAFSCFCLYTCIPSYPKFILKVTPELEAPSRLWQVCLPRSIWTFTAECRAPVAKASSLWSRAGLSQRRGCP